MRKIMALAMTAAGIALAQPAAAQSADCAAGPFTVFFDADSDAIHPRGAAILDSVAAAFRACSQPEVAIAGHTDREGTDGDNVRLSQRMAANVRSYLAARGIPDGRMTSEAYGETRPLIVTRDGAREPRNRRVELTFGPGSGG